MINTSSDKINLQNLARLCAMKGMRHVVLSPGSRNAPLIVAFNRESGIKCHVVVDERSAAYFALGIAQQLDEPVGVICTSGTALLNFAPAVAEAYYQRLPLIIMSADRPEEWIDQDDSQTIHQYKALDNFVKASYQLPVDRTEEPTQWYINRCVNEALILSMRHRRGPVHLNIPLSEPLYNVSAVVRNEPRIIRRIDQSATIDPSELEEFASCLSRSPKVMILASFQLPSILLQQTLSTIASNPQIIVLTETVSNLYDSQFISCIDRTICRIPESQIDAFMPDILITFGGSVITKMMKKLLRSSNIGQHWFIQTGEHIIDTFGKLTVHMDMEPEAFFSELQSLNIANNTSSYALKWHQLEARADKCHEEYMHNISWSDLKAFETITQMIPANSRLQLSNGTSIRYHQLFKGCQATRINANRGTSGIDGSTSTAAGAASVYDGPTTLITGDISFLYDTNGLWNNRLSPNLKIIVLNNGGGGIFRFIKGPSQLDELETYFETPPKVSIRLIAEAYGLEYFEASDNHQLKENMKKIYLSDKATLLNVITPREINDKVLKDYFKQNGK